MKNSVPLVQTSGTLAAAFLLAATALLKAQQCEILSVDTNRVLTLYVDQTNLYCGLQYRLGLGPGTDWQNEIEPPYWNFTNTDYITSITLPESVLLEQSVFIRAVCSTNPLPVPSIGSTYEVYVAPYSITSPLWRYRLNRTLTNWIPHLYAQLNKASLEGGINDFIQAGNKLLGLPYTVPDAFPFADAYTLNTVESMCYALMYDPQGDPAIINAQNAFRSNLRPWISLILRAQESDGYLHTYTTLRGGTRWSDRDAHEGYVGGYFIDAGLAHYLMTGRSDPTMYNAAKKLADCWCDNIGPGKKTWWDGHENMEQALVRLGRFVNEYEGAGAGQKYIALAKFLMDSRGNGEPFDQSQVPVIQQSEAVGHAVRAVYLYSGMEGVAMETGDVDYQSAALSLWDNLVNKKYYVTGGVGSGETWEGFGPDYSLPNNSYCETCAGCGTLFFFHQMNLAYHNARYADLMENVLYNEILGSLDDAATSIFYDNPLTGSGWHGGRASWYFVACCYGNAPRTLFQLPTWMYTRSPDAIYVNLFIGSTVSVPDISGTTVQMVQTTDYPWSNRVAIVVNPGVTTNFTVNIREPDRTWSQLYTPTPAVSGFTSIQLNGQPITPVLTKGYASITRTWTAGDTVEFVLPMEVQRIKADSQVAADVGLVALQYGPLIYNIESADQNTGLVLSPSAPLSVQYTNILGGFMKITGGWTNGAALTAIPNYARLNRGGDSDVWFRDQ